MKKKKNYNFPILIVTIIVAVVMLSFGSFYAYWNSASPDKTCASCHEIGASVHSFSLSSHRELACKECHGTALSNGFHSIKEKGKMVVSHFGDKIPERIRMSEDQLLEVMEDCRRCHASEFSNWLGSGHSANYAAIFLDTKHNSTEQLNPDCLRCHGMFYDGRTEDLVTPISIEGPWNLLDPKMAEKPTIPCMACHQIHKEGDVSRQPDYSEPKSIFYSREDKSPAVGFYDRNEKFHIAATMLPKLQLSHNGKPVVVSDDFAMRNCVQCHAPDGFHEAGTRDDRTPRGVHEGLTCMACHEPHSNDSRNSCAKCHPAISNCNLDVMAMNTTFADTGSKNNIHWVSCTDCHENEVIKNN
jgi:hypothetical protein